MSARKRNPAKRRRRSRRRNPSLLMANRSAPRRTVRRRRRGGRARARVRGFVGKSAGGIGSAFKAGGALFGGELLGDLMARGAVKFGAAKVLNAVKVPADMQPGVVRVAIGLFGEPILRMVGVPRAIRQGFSAINVASGLIGLTWKFRAQAMQSIGLSDYELADEMDLDDDGMSDYELATDDPALLGEAPPAGLLEGDYSDQDYYANYG